MQRSMQSRPSEGHLEAVAKQFPRGPKWSMQWGKSQCVSNGILSRVRGAGGQVRRPLDARVQEFLHLGCPGLGVSELVIALAQVKKAAAAANTKLGVLDAEKARAI